MNRQVTFNMGIMNIPKKIGAEKQETCWTILKNHSGVFGTNETIKKSMKQLFFNLVRKHGWDVSGLDTPNPIFWNPKKWKFIRSRVVKLHDRGPWWRQFFGYNAARWVFIVELERIGKGTIHVFMNTHLVPNGKKVPGKWRSSVREISKQKLAELVREYHDEEKFVHLMGDMNIPEKIELPGVMKFFRWIRAKGIDKIGSNIPEGWDADWHFNMIPAPTDHKHGVVARLHFLERGGDKTAK